MPSDAPAKVPRDALVMPSPGVGFQNHLSEFPHAFRKVCSTGTLGLHARHAAAASPKAVPPRDGRRESHGGGGRAASPEGVQGLVPAHRDLLSDRYRR